MPLLSLLGDPTTYQGLQTDTFIDYAARELHRKTLRYELAIFKYGTLPEPTIKQIFKKAEIISRGHASPGIYLELDQSTRGLFTEDGRVPFYRALVGRFIDALEQTRFGETDEARRLRELYETSFDEIYNTEEIGYRPDGNYLPDPLLKQFFNIGMNLSTLVNSITQKWYHPIPLINISTVPNFPKGAVTVEENPENAIIPQNSGELEAATSHTLTLLQDLFKGGKHMRKGIAFPGWTAEVLTNSTRNQRWFKSHFNERGILEELGFKDKFYI